jgi:hypothetical protein
MRIHQQTYEKDQRLLPTDQNALLASITHTHCFIHPSRTHGLGAQTLKHHHSRKL